MPELPEVEGFRRRVAPLIAGQRIERLDVRDAKPWRPAAGLSADAVAGRRVRGLDRRAKLLIATLEGGLALVLHLKIAGQLVYQSPDGRRLIGGHPYPLPEAALPNPSTRFVLHFDGGILFVNDQRRFAWLRLIPAAELEPFIAEQRYGPDPLHPSFTPTVLAARLAARRGRPVKAALLDQTCVAGLGNIYADEALHGAQLHPMTRCGDLSEAEVQRLHAAIGRILQVAVPVGGALVKIGRAVPDPESGRDFLQAHGRAGERCLTCAAEGRTDGASGGRSDGASGGRSGGGGGASGTKAGDSSEGHGPRIVRAVLAGRGTYFCPVCQAPRLARCAPSVPTPNVDTSPSPGGR